MKTLAVDDDLRQAGHIAELMNSIDVYGSHEVEVDPRNALDKVAKTRYDVIWLDIEMPKMTGLEMAKEIKDISPNTNVVFVSAHPEYALEAMNLRASGFVVKPATPEQLKEEINNLRHPIGKDTKDYLLRIQCFGNFEAFSKDGKRIRFARSLSKEALAYLVDRRGAGCTINELCTVLWEDRQADVNLKSQCRVILSSLCKDLKAVGAEGILVKMWNTWGVDAAKISCDYYDFLRSETGAVKKFHGEYMAQYSWAETTIGALYELTKKSS
jgi:two-component SAPR family response regulator